MHIPNTSPVSTVIDYMYVQRVPHCLVSCELVSVSQVSEFLSLR